MDPDMQQNTRSIGMYSQYVYCTQAHKTNLGLERNVATLSALSHNIFIQEQPDGCIAVRFIKKII